MSWIGFIVFVVYAAFFVLTLFSIAWLGRWRRRTRRPLPENYKLLRMPGEYLWRRSAPSENDLEQWFAAVMAPPLIGLAVLSAAHYLFPTLPYLVIVAAGIAFLVAFVISIWWVDKKTTRLANDYLGFFGERYVAEFLEPLKAQGWVIFHDLQCNGAAGKFNIDHVAVGPGGLWVVETKTRRKGRARPGFKDYEVAFDGQQLIWPWGEDTTGLKQASDKARWLADWLEQMTGKKHSVAAVLTFPGWLVTERHLGPVRVVNPKALPNVVISRGRNVLSVNDADLIRRQLEQLCRDVEY